MEFDDAWASEPSSSSGNAVFPAISNHQAPLNCTDCEEALATLTCPKCNPQVCDACWGQRTPHLRKLNGHMRVRLDGSRAEQGDSPSEMVFQQVAQIVDPRFWSKQPLEEQHRHDYSTLWFAITDSGDGSLSFEARPRFGELMRQYRQEYPGAFPCHPQLVSFVGGTGAGKSTLIKMLIRQPWSSTAKKDGSDTSIPVPVIGDDSAIPTSSDVHLYFGPIRDEPESRTPLLFADCEGFDGAGRSSAAATMASDMKIVEAGEHQTNKDIKKWVSHLVQATVKTFKRRLSWSKSVDDRRQSALEQLFPRLLYNVSDVVVYVIAETEFRKIGRVLEQLVEWSKKSAKAAVNRGSLPALIVVLNQSDPSRNKWDPEETTQRLLRDNQDLVVDGLKYAYTSVKFIRIPRGEDLERLASQVQTLRDVIRTAATLAHTAKEATGTLLNSDHQDLFYNIAFEHFSQHKDEPFDFMETFFSIHPLPMNLANTLVELFRATKKALATTDRPSHSRILARDMLQIVVPVIASAIAVDIHRSDNFPPGSLYNLIQGEMCRPEEVNLEVRNFSYEKQIGTAIQRFLETSCECWFHDSRGLKCVNNAVAHKSGRQHQDAQGRNIGLGTGVFEENPFHEEFMGLWEDEFKKSLSYLDSVRIPRPTPRTAPAPAWSGSTASCSPRETTEDAEDAEAARQRLWRIRKTVIQDMYQKVPNFHFTDISGCFWCLRNIPTERLPCGHWICESCLLQIGEPSPHDDRLRLLRQCDRHDGERTFHPPFEFLHLPPTTGRRLLCLDEGGIRAFTQLIILDAVQQELGKEILLQDCFDLIGGTGAGGIISLGLVFGNWYISEAIEKFTQFVKGAFSKKTGWSFFWWFSSNTYQPETLDQSINDAFGKNGKLAMVDSMSTRSNCGKGPARVFVTASVTGQGGEILTNYHRRQDSGLEHARYSQASYTSSCARTIGEAARATFSIPGYFDSLQTSDGKEYLGGALHFCTPAPAAFLEAQYLWPHAMKTHPDVLMSIGSGHSTLPLPLADDAEAQWNDTFGDRSKHHPDRYIRLSPDFKDSIPCLDDVEVLESGHLELAVAEFLRNDRRQAVVQDGMGSKVDLIARRLISTTFYFHQTSPVEHEDGKTTITGHIRCRFKNSSDVTKAFGGKISALGFPGFVLESSKSVLWSFSEESLDHMRSQGVFCARVSFSIPDSSNIVDIKFKAHGFVSESISGCPFSIG